MTDRNEVRMDVRELAAPEPLRRILPRLETLEEGQFVHVIHRRDPQCLYELVEQLGFRHLTRSAANDRFDIWLWRETDQRAALAVQAATTNR